MGLSKEVEEIARTDESWCYGWTWWLSHMKDHWGLLGNLIPGISVFAEFMIGFPTVRNLNLMRLCCHLFFQMQSGLAGAILWWMHPIPRLPSWYLSAAVAVQLPGRLGWSFLQSGWVLNPCLSICFKMQKAGSAFQLTHPVLALQSSKHLGCSLYKPKIYLLQTWTTAPITSPARMVPHAPILVRGATLVHADLGTQAPTVRLKSMNVMPTRARMVEAAL